MWAAYRELIALRRSHPALARSTRSGSRAEVEDGSLLTIYRTAHDSPDEAVCFCNFGTAQASAAVPCGPGARWKLLADSTWPRFGGDGTDAMPDTIENGEQVTIAPAGFCVYGA